MGTAERLDVTTERSEFGIGQSAGLDLRDPALADVHDLCELALGRGLFPADLREGVRADLSDGALLVRLEAFLGHGTRRQRRHASRPTTVGPTASSRSFALLFLDPLARSDTRRSDLRVVPGPSSSRPCRRPPEAPLGVSLEDEQDPEVGGAPRRSEFLRLERRSLDVIHASARYQRLDGLRDLVGEARLPLAEFELPVLDLLE